MEFGKVTYNKASRLYVPEEDYIEEQIIAIINKISAERVKYGISQSALSINSECNPRLVYTLESGDTINPTLRTVVALLTSLGLKVEITKMDKTDINPRIGPYTTDYGFRVED